MKRGHHEVITAIECRDRSRPVGVPEIEAFFQKCQDTGINCSVIVSATGFYRSAKKKAVYYGIACFKIDEAAGFDWILSGGMKFYQRRLEDTRCTAMPVELIEEAPVNFVIRAPNGREFTNDMMLANVRKVVDKLMSERVPEAGLVKCKFFIQSPGFWIEDLDRGTHYTKIR